MEDKVQKMYYLFLDNLRRMKGKYIQGFFQLPSNGACILDTPLVMSKEEVTFLRSKNLVTLKFCIKTE